MAAKDTMKNMVMCLFVVCLVCSAVLAVAYAVTKEPIEAAAAQKTSDAISVVLPSFDATPVESTIEVGGKQYSYYTATKAGQTVGYAITSVTNGFGGALSIMVGVTADGIVYNTSVLSHSETPGLGAKCTTDQHFIDQFKGLNPAQKILSVKKDGGDIDAITASTITSRAYTLAIKNAVDVFKAIQAKEVKND
jgi:electron transport complex protein RnfG